MIEGYSSCHPVQRMGKTNYSQQYMAYYLAANPNNNGFYVTKDNWNNLQLFWWNFPHLIVKPIEYGLEIKFPKCDK